MIGELETGETPRLAQRTASVQSVSTPTIRRDSVAMFKRAAAGALFVHFGRRMLDTVPSLEGGRRHVTESLGTISHQRTSILDMLAPGWGVRAFFTVTMALCVWAIVRRTSRVHGAVLYVASVLTSRAIETGPDIDNYLANVACLFLLVLPSPYPLAAASPRNQTVLANGVAKLLLGWATVLYLTAGFGYFTAATWPLPLHPTTILRLIPVAYVLPGLRPLALLGQAFVHIYLVVVGQGLFIHLIALATVPLFWRLWDDSEPSRFRADAGTILAAALSVAFGISAVGAGLGGPFISLRQILSDVGLPPTLQAVARATEPPAKNSSAAVR